MPLPTDMYDLIGIMDRQYFYTKVLNLISELKEKVIYLMQGLKLGRPTFPLFHTPLVNLCAVHATFSR